MNIQQLMQRLSSTRPVFHSEADFQHALAWELQREHPDAQVRLETRPFPSERVALDLYVTVAERRVAFELKHLMRALDVEVGGERFVLRGQGAHDLGRYDVIKDIGRVERIVAAGIADEGYIITLSNDSRYWQPGRATTIDAAFRLDEGKVLSGAPAWAAHAGGTIKKRESAITAITLGGVYRLRWRHFSEVSEAPGGSLRYLSVAVPPDTAAADILPEFVAEGSPGNGSPSASPPREPDRTSARAAVLAAFTRLEQRTQREAFLLQEVLAELTRVGTPFKESTLRTHITSVMCRQAPANHATRYEDLERVDRGMYRRSRRPGREAGPA